MKTIPAFFVLATFLVIGSFANAAAKDEPMQTLSAKIDNVLDVLKSQKENRIEAEKAKKQIWDIVNATFDFQTISTRAVGKSWNSFSQQEKKDFVDVFSTLLGNTYLSKLETYNNEKVSYLSQEIQGQNKAVVKTAIIRQAGNIPMDYNLQKKDAAWFIYDVKVEGISLVKNYRTQFSSFLAKNSPADLIKRLKEKNSKKADGKKDNKDSDDRVL